MKDTSPRGVVFSNNRTQNGRAFLLPPAKKRSRPYSTADPCQVEEPDGILVYNVRQTQENARRYPDFVCAEDRSAGCGRQGERHKTFCPNGLRLLLGRHLRRRRGRCPPGG